jgi:HK97 family phage portal protein
MGIFDGIKSAFGRANRERMFSPAGVSVGGRIPYPKRGTYLLHVQNGYKANPIVAGCVGLLSSTMNEAPLGVMNDDGTVNLNHPLSVMFRRPNPYMGQAQFWAQCWQFLSLSGNAYIKIVRGPMGNMTGLLPYGDAHVAPIRDENGWIIGYQYSSQGVTQNWLATDVIQLRHPLYIDPLALDMGMSPIEVCWDKIQTYNELQSSIYSLVASNMVPSGILTAPGEVPSGTVASLKQQLQKRRDAKGRERTEPLVLANGMSYVQMGLDANQIQATETIRELEAAICAAFRIHPAVIGSSAGLSVSTYSNLQTAYAEYTTLTRVPFWNSIEEQIESGLGKEYPGVQLAFDTTQVQALQPDVDSVIYPVIAEFNANVITLNETRSRLGFEPVEDGDKYAYEVVPPSIGFGMAADDGPDSQVAGGAPAEMKFDLIGGRIKWDEGYAVKSWQDEERILKRSVSETEPFVVELMDSAKRGAEKKARSGRGNPADGIKVEELVNKYMTATKAVRDKLARQIIEMTITSANVDLATVQSAIDEIIGAQSLETNKMMKESCETLKREVAKIAEDNAGDVDAITSKITAKFESITASRAATIARTTVRAQSTVVQNEAITQVNKREPDENKRFAMVWLSQRDDDVRESHEELDGLSIDVGESWTQYNPGITKGPGIGTDPAETINCRCVQRPTRKSRIQQ